MLEQKRQDWTEMLQNNNESGTISHYESWAMRYEDWREWSGTEVSIDNLVAFESFLSDSEVMDEFWEEYVDEHSAWNLCRIPDDGYAYASRVKAISAAKSYIDYVYDMTFPDRQRYKVDDIVSGGPPPFDPVIASPEEVEKLWDEIEDCSVVSCHPMARLSYDAIMRSCEVVRVKWDHVNMDRGTVWVDSAKNSPKRHVKLSPKTMDVLDEWRSLVKSEFDDPKWMFYKFQGYRQNNRWTARNWGRHISSRHWSAGSHSLFRHSAITNRLNNGESLTDVSRRARHSSLEQTVKYDQLTENASIPKELQ